MKRIARLFNPLVVFITVQIIWIGVVVFWIYWFVGQNQKLRALAETYRPELLTGPGDWFILTEGLFLLILILAGLYVIFIYWRRQLNISRAYRDFISQVTHELKSPLASLQLHLETMQLRHPSGEKLDGFLTTMLADTSRLHSTIDNLLSASRLEQKQGLLNRQPADFSAFTADYLERFRREHRGTYVIESHIEPGVWAKFDTDAFATALRNLLENAIIYSDGTPMITVSLSREKESLHLSVADRGRGIAPDLRTKVFTMFYRIRGGGDKTRGTGLGLYIVRTLVKAHNGKVWLESRGAGTGTTVHISLPRIAKP